MLRSVLVAAAFASASATLCAAEALGQSDSPPSTAPATDAAAAPPRTFPIPSPLPPTAALPGDDQLDCATLYAESKARLRQNSEINDAALSKAYTKGAETQALEVLGQVGSMVPILGDVIAMGSAAAQMATTKNDAERNYGESTRKSDWVMDRMVHVSDLYRDRCLKRSK